MTHTVDATHGDPPTVDHALTRKIRESVTKYLAGHDESEEEEEDRIPTDREALVSLPITSIEPNQFCTKGNIASINMQAEGIACLQSIAFDSPPDIRRCRLTQWPAEVSRFQDFCMRLYKPTETGFGMLALILKYSPRAWNQSEKYRSGLKSIAAEHQNSFFKYASSVSNKNERRVWQLAFNYHAKKHNLGLSLGCTPEGQLYQENRQTAPKRKRDMATSDEERKEVTGLYRSISTGQHISDAERDQLKIMYESLCAQTKAPNKCTQQASGRTPRGTRGGSTRNDRQRPLATCEGRHPTGFRQCGRRR